MDGRAFFAGPHRCRRCEATFSTEDKLARHVARMHPGRRRVRQVAAAAALVIVLSAVAWAGQPEPRPGGLGPLAVDDDPAMGEDAPAHLVVFSAPLCRECATFFLDVLPAVAAGPVAAGSLQIHFVAAAALAGMDRSGALAQECAYRLGGPDAHHDFTTRMFENQSRLDEHSLHVLLEQQAVASGVPEETIMRCYYAEETLSAVQRDWHVARGHAPAGALTLLWVEGQTVRGVSLEDVQALAAP